MRTQSFLYGISLTALLMVGMVTPALAESGDRGHHNGYRHEQGVNETSNRWRRGDDRDYDRHDDRRYEDRYYDRPYNNYYYPPRYYGPPSYYYPPRYYGPPRYYSPYYPPRYYAPFSFGYSGPGIFFEYSR